jgi:hypothetical protein
MTLLYYIIRNKFELYTCMFFLSISNYINMNLALNDVVSVYKTIKMNHNLIGFIKEIGILKSFFHQLK